MVRIPTHGAPTHPGEMLLEEFLKPLGMPQAQVAEKIGVSYPRVNELVHGKRGRTPERAIRLEGSSVWRHSSGSTSSWPGISTMRPIRLQRRKSGR